MDKPAAEVTPDVTYIGTVTLKKKIQRPDSAIATISLREPAGPALLNVSLYDLMRMDAGEIIKVLPKIADPVVTPQEAMMLGGADLFRIGQEISAFLLLSADG